MARGRLQARGRKRQGRVQGERQADQSWRGRIIPPSSEGWSWEKSEFPSNVAGEEKRYLPERSKAAFGGVFSHFLWLLSGSSAYLYVEGGKKPTYVC